MTLFGKIVRGSLLMSAAFLFGPVAGSCAVAAALVFTASPGFRRIVGNAFGSFVGMIDRTADRLDSYSSQAPKRRQENVAVRKRNAENSRRFYDRSLGQWNIDAMPKDAVVDDIGSKRLSFSVGGVYEAMTGYLENGVAAFRSRLFPDSARDAVMSIVNDKELRNIRFTNGVPVGFYLDSFSPDALCNVLLTFYNTLVREVECTLSSTTRYAVQGCSSYEEAVARLSDPSFDRNAAFYDSVVRTEGKVDGRPVQARDDRELALPQGEIPLGCYFVDETMTSVMKGRVSSLPGEDDADLFDRARRAGTLESSSDVVFSTSNALKESNMEKSVTIDGHQVPLYDRESFDRLPQADVFIHLENLKEVDSVLSSMKHRVVLVDTERHDAEGKYLVSIPVDSSLVLSGTSNLVSNYADRLQREYGEGISREDALLTAFAYVIDREGYDSVFLNENIDLSRAVVNGVPLDEFREVNSKLSDRLDEEQRRVWVEESRQIRQVDMNINLKTMRMNVDVQLADGSLLQYSHPVTYEQAQEIASRDVTPTDRKDLAMHLLAGRQNGAKFSVYDDFDWRHGHVGQQSECLAAFVENREPLSLHREHVKGESVAESPAKVERKAYQMKM